MELGIGMFADMRYDKESGVYQPAAQRLHELIEQVVLADELGIDVFSVGEHHREDYAVSSPEIILAALATKTKNITLGSGVSIVSSTDPVKLYQDFSMIDLISNGRAEIMAGRGSFIESFPLFGYNLDDYNELFEEKLALLLELNKNKSLSWTGKFRAPIHNQTVYPQPERKLPVWIAVGGTPASVLRAARYGLPITFAIIGGSPQQFTPLIEFYKEKYVEFGHDPAKMQIGVHAHSFIAASKDEVVGTYFPYYAGQMGKIGKERGWRAGFTETQFRAGMSQHGALVMGNTNEVAEKTIEMIEMFGLTRFLAHIDTGGPTHKQLMHTIEEFGSKVIPQVKKAVAK